MGAATPEAMQKLTECLIYAIVDTCTRERNEVGLVNNLLSCVLVTGRGSLRPPAASRCCARKLAARSFPRRPPA